MDIIVSNLSKGFGAKHVLTDFSAIFPEHEVTCLMGPSGCGKTTLLNILMGFYIKTVELLVGYPRIKVRFFKRIGFAKALMLFQMCVLFVTER